MVDSPTFLSAFNPAPQSSLPSKVEGPYHAHTLVSWNLTHLSAVVLCSLWVVSVIRISLQLIAKLAYKEVSDYNCWQSLFSVYSTNTKSSYFKIFFARSHSHRRNIPSFTVHQCDGNDIICYYITLPMWCTGESCDMASVSDDVSDCGEGLASHVTHSYSVTHYNYWLVLSRKPVSKQIRLCLQYGNLYPNARSYSTGTV